MACSVLLHGQAFSYALVGRAAVARVLKGIHAGRLPTASLHTGGADGPQPIPLESKEKRGCLAVTLTRPVVLAGIEPAPPLPLSSQKARGQTGFKTSEYFYLWSARVTSRYITWVPALRLARVIAIYTPCSTRQYQHRPMKFFK